MPDIILQTRMHPTLRAILKYCAAMTGTTVDALVNIAIKKSIASGEWVPREQLEKSLIEILSTVDNSGVTTVPGVADETLATLPQIDGEGPAGYLTRNQPEDKK